MSVTQPENMESAQNLFVEAGKWNASKVYYGKPKSNPSGGKNIGVMDGDLKKPLALSTPLMLTWGSQEWTDDKTGKKSYDLSLQFPREDDEGYEKTIAFLESLKQFEQKLLDDALVNSRDWLGKEHKIRDVVEALFTPILRYPKDQQTKETDYSRPPSIRVKIPFWDDKFTCELYNTDGDLIFPDVSNDLVSPLTLVTKGQKIAVIMKCGGIWVANGKFGVTWKLVQAVVQPRVSLRGRCHIKLDTTERLALKKEAEKHVEEDEPEDDHVVATQVEDTDNEDEPQEVAEPAEPERPPTPQPEPKQEKPAEPKKKRVVTRKKKE